MYGVRVRSRLREMFNLITFPKETQDKRKWYEKSKSATKNQSCPCGMEIYKTKS
jgi:hypothetical protein